MPGLPSSLRLAIKKALLQTDLFANEFRATDLLVDERLNAWQDRVPTTGRSANERVNSWIHFFNKQENGHGLLKLLLVIQDETVPSQTGRDLGDLIRHLRTHLAIREKEHMPDLDFELQRRERKQGGMHPDHDLELLVAEWLPAIIDHLNQFSDDNILLISHGHRINPDPRSRQRKKWYAHKLVHYYPDVYADQRDAERKFTNAWETAKQRPFAIHGIERRLIAMPVRGKYVMNIPNILDELHPHLDAGTKYHLLRRILTSLRVL